ncbi:MAG: ribonuclease E/G [Alphaproteobacteria bacterium]|nr:ribonuclease E/G [Alphaproteobacteria bacterium]
MAKKLLIDASHPEEIRVAVVNGTILDEYDSESSSKKQIKGNIYLAKIIRIEPSLQAAFVDFGGNRHGFLPFGEIHPDYYRIPVSDRSGAEAQPLDATPVSDTPTFAEKEGEETFHHEIIGNITGDITTDALLNFESSTDMEEGEDFVDAAPLTVEHDSFSEKMDDLPSDDHSHADDDYSGEDRPAAEDRPARAPRPYRYKIQEVIKRRQIILVQVVKEERGSKGASLTTYLSLPGRYCVLMPNAGHRSGGVSRKIHDGEDRRRLRDVVKELDVPEGIALIVRTAGQERNKLEIKRDYEYLLRLWSDIRNLTLESIAPYLVYAEGDLVKRSIRDIYSKDIQEILVEGEEAYKDAKAFMKNLIPSHTRKVQFYNDPNIPLFHRFKIEEQIEEMMCPSARLPSGGSIVISQTEALVAIDVNSGRSTKERHIEETALKTNLEAADEVARQLRLRDLGGLIVVDFIDMNDQGYIQQVEKRIRDAMRFDRARVQLGKISQFGLFELSRQRLRPSLIETNTTPCSHCHGTGLMRSTESMAMHVLRTIESNVIQGRARELLVTVPSGIDLYLLNQKRQTLISIESQFNVSIQIARDASITAPDFRIDVLTDQAEAIEPVKVLGPRIDTRRVVEVPEKLPELAEEIAPIGDEAVVLVKPKRHPRRRNRNPNRPPLDASVAPVTQEAARDEGFVLVDAATPPEQSDQVSEGGSESDKPADPRNGRRYDRRYRHRRRQSKPGEINAGGEQQRQGQQHDSGHQESVQRTPIQERPLQPAAEQIRPAGTPKKGKSWIRRLLE